MLLQVVGGATATVARWVGRHLAAAEAASAGAAAVGNAVTGSLGAGGEAPMASLGRLSGLLARITALSRGSYCGQGVGPQGPNVQPAQVKVLKGKPCKVRRLSVLCLCLSWNLCLGSGTGKSKGAQGEEQLGKGAGKGARHGGEEGEGPRRVMGP